MQQVRYIVSEPAAKRQEVIADSQPVVMTKGNEEAMTVKDDTQKKPRVGKRAPMGPSRPKPRHITKVTEPFYKGKTQNVIT